MNKVLLIGRLTAKPELRYTGSNLPYTRFSIAVNRNFTNSQGQREADFINCIAWRKQAENICNYLDKGSKVSVEGRIQTGSFDDKEGKKRYTTDVVADNVEFLESKAQAQSKTEVPTPYDYQNKENPTNNVSIEEDNPFAEYGEEVTIDDNFLE
jgi:single-strand DNA-binding protein